VEVKVLFTISRDIHAKHGSLKIGKYTVEPLPCSQGDLVGSNIRYLLRFQDEMRPGEKMSQPLIEARLFLSFFSLLTRSQLEIDSSMINDVKEAVVPVKDAYREYKTILEDLPNFELGLDNLKNLDYDRTKQFLRACEVYRTAVNLINSNNTLCFFLLCVAIECISNNVSQKESACEKFIDFIITYLPEKKDFKTDADLIEILKEIYYNHRSGFTHGGKSIPEAVSLADMLNRIYIRNIIDGKEVRTPSLKWFEHIVRASLIGYLSKVEQEQKNSKIDILKEISLESGRVILKTKGDIKPGHLVTSSDVEMD
jgi:hypothetical protein